MMGLFEHWPYVNFHELNMDWIIQLIKTFQAEYAQFKIDWANLQDDWEAQQQAFQALQQFVTDYFDNLDVQQEINNKLDEMAANGTLWDIMQPYVDEQLEGLKVYTTPELFGAVGDGVTDDTNAIKQALSSDIDTVVFTKSYLVSDIIDVTDKTLISFTNANIIINNQVTEREWFLVASGSNYIKGIHFIQKIEGKTLGLLNNENTHIESCTFDCDDGLLVKGLLDLYTNNKNVYIENCVFNHASTGIGGIWIREFYADHKTSNIIIDNSFLTSRSGIDEILAIYGANGTVENVKVSNTTIESTSAASMPHMISVGLGGVMKNVNFTGCTIRNSGAGTTIFKNQPSGGGSSQFISIDNCSIINTKENVKAIIGDVFVTSTKIYTSESIAFGFENSSHKTPVFYSCNFESEKQMLELLGTFKSCVFDMNELVSENYHMNKYGITLRDCEMNGINCSGTLFQIAGANAPVIIDNVKINGTLGSLFMSVSVATIIKMTNSYIHKKMNVSNASATGYIIGCVSSENDFGTTGNLVLQNNIFDIDY